MISIRIHYQCTEYITHFFCQFNSNNRPIRTLLRTISAVKACLVALPSDFFSFFPSMQHHKNAERDQGVRCSVTQMWPAEFPKANHWDERFSHLYLRLFVLPQSIWDYLQSSSSYIVVPQSLLHCFTTVHNHQIWDYSTISPFIHWCPSALHHFITVPQVYGPRRHPRSIRPSHTVHRARDVKLARLWYEL
jgi:hypothetical protein